MIALPWQMLCGNFILPRGEKSLWIFYSSVQLDFTINRKFLIMAVSEKHLKRAAENERENAAICLFCTKEECTGADACFREQKKQRQRQYQTDRRKAELSLDAFYNAQQAKENRRRRMEAQAAFQKRKEAE